MRLAVAMPGLERDSLHCRALEATLEAMAEAGVDLEGFAEHDRLAAEDLGFPIYHYLRLPERHRFSPFDVALYPIGRDASPYQAACWLMRQAPSVAWLFDSVLHHLALGGIALMGRWRSYRDLLEAAYGDIGAALTQAVAQNWGTNSLFRHYDLVAELTRDQHAVIASWPALAGRLASRMPNRGIAVAPLPLVEDPKHWQINDKIRGRSSTTAILSMNCSNPAGSVAAAAAVLGTDPEAKAVFCTSTFAYANGARESARRQGIHDRIDWILDPNQGSLTSIVREASVLIWLDEDLRADGRALLLHGLAGGRLTIVPRSDLYGDIPEGVVAKVDPGHSLGPEIAAFLEMLGKSASLRRGMQQSAVTFARSIPAAAEAAAQLQEILETLADPTGLRISRVSAPVWDALDEDLATHLIPAAATVSTHRLLSEIIGNLAERQPRVSEDGSDRGEGEMPE